LKPKRRIKKDLKGWGEFLRIKQKKIII